MLRAYRAAWAVMLGCVLVAATVACSGAGDRATMTTSVATFTCCQQTDIDTVRHPGETFDVHWMMTLVPAEGGVVTDAVVLSVALSDGYRDVAQLKATESRAPTVLARAADVTTSSAAATAPISRITIPESATPGFYNLTTSVQTGGSTLSGSAIIRIERYVGPIGAPACCTCSGIRDKSP